MSQGEDIWKDELRNDETDEDDNLETFHHATRTDGRDDDLESRRLIQW